MYGGFYRMDSTAAMQQPYSGGWYPHMAQSNTGGYHATPRNGVYHNGAPNANVNANNSNNSNQQRGSRINSRTGGTGQQKQPQQQQPSRQQQQQPQVQQQQPYPLGRIPSAYNMGFLRGPQHPNNLSGYGGFAGYPGSGRSTTGSSSNPMTPVLPRVNSGVNFDYSFGSFHRQNSMNYYPTTNYYYGMRNGSNSNNANQQQLRNTPSFRSDQGMSSLMDIHRNNSGYNFLQPATAPGAGGGGPMMNRVHSGGNLSRQGSAFGGTPYTPFGSFSYGLPGMGPGASVCGSSARSNASSTQGVSSHTASANQTQQQQQSQPQNLARSDSATSLHRSYSVAGQFAQYNNPWGGMMMPQPGMAINSRTGCVAMHAMQQQQQQQQQEEQQRRLSSQTKKPNSSDTVEEGAPVAGLGRKNSQSNLDRQDSQKRVGMYFKNKDAESDAVQYVKDGDPGTTKTASSRQRDPSLENAVKPILLIEMPDDNNNNTNDIEIDGRTLRAMRPGMDEVQKYDMHDIISVSRATDVEVLADSLNELRDLFVYGNNVGMIMADADCPADDPAGWFSWTALRTVVKGVFGKLSTQEHAEVTMSMCLLREDQCMDLISDDVQSFAPLVVAESPLFGNVANGLVYLVVESAAEFNDALDGALARATAQSSDSSEEFGILLCTCVLKNIRVSPSSGRKDVTVSSIFASGVGDGVMHYSRILDKNPAEPRALFYSVLHRSVHSTAIFYTRSDNPEVYNLLSILQRFGKVETRKPKVGSVRAFISYAESTIPRIQKDMEKIEGRQKVQSQRFLERLQLMSADASVMLEDPENCVPRTYI